MIFSDAIDLDAVEDVESELVEIEVPVEEEVIVKTIHFDAQQKIKSKHFLRIASGIRKNAIEL